MEELKRSTSPLEEKVDAIAKLADAFAKTISAFGRANPQLNRLAIGLEVIKEFMVFLQTKNFPKEQLQELLFLLDEFGEK